MSSKAKAKKANKGGNRRQTNGDSAPIAKAVGQKVREPRITQSDRCTRIVHRELVGTVTGTTSFGVFNSYELNPGLSSTFPWLSSQADSWEQYRFRYLRFRYVPRCATTTIGSVMMAPDYDALDAPPSSELTAMSYREATEDAPWKEQVCGLNPSSMFPAGPRKYVRSGLVAGDLKTYDAGVMHVCTTEESDTSALGKLWVEYDVEFFVPQTEPSQVTASNFALFNLSSDQSMTTGVAATVAFDEEVVNSCGIVNTSGSFVLPKGAWLVRGELEESGGTAGTGISLELEIKSGGSALTPPVKSRVTLTATGTSLYRPTLPISGYVASDGSTPVTIEAIATSGSGTLVMAGDYCRVYFTLL